MTDWELGFQAFRQGRLREAADRLRAAAGERERSVTQAARFQTLAYLGAALYALGRPTEAVSAFEDAVRFAPPPSPPADLTINMIYSYLAAGRGDAAHRTLQQLLRDAPGNQEAQMLLRRLEQRSPDDPLTGTTLGESTAGVLSYLRTLSFSRVTSGGLDPAQVRLAIAQVERYVEFMARQLVVRDESVARLEAELEQARQRESDMADALMETHLRTSGGGAPSPAPSDGDDAPRTPLDALLQQKPR